MPITRLSSALTGQSVTRSEKCSVCCHTEGLVVGNADYWDIRSVRIIKCPVCRHIQIDPMLSEEETAVGCHAYYLLESQQAGRAESEKNCIRNFRRGVVFGMSLKSRKIIPLNVLEAGPGSGYFAAGLNFIFPAVNVTVMDVNPAVLEMNREHHNFQAIRGIPDTHIPDLDNRFDLIIARDLLEHVSDISLVLRNFNRYLLPGGHLHFITPNGHEDVWKHFLTWNILHSPSELLINHVNYFDGRGLRNLLQSSGFREVDFFSFKFSTTLKGKGWRWSRGNMAPLSEKRKARSMNDLNIPAGAPEMRPKQVILRKWYISERFPLLTMLYSLYQHNALLRLNPDYNIGHEFHGLFRKISGQP